MNIFAMLIPQEPISACTHYSDISSLNDGLINSDLDALDEWSLQNKMVINTRKTKSILVTGKRIPKKWDSLADQRLQLRIGGIDISGVTSQKLLGITLDTNMSYEVHVEELAKKGFKTLRIVQAYQSLSQATSTRNILHWRYQAYSHVW